MTVSGDHLVAGDASLLAYSRLMALMARAGEVDDAGDVVLCTARVSVPIFNVAVIMRPVADHAALRRVIDALRDDGHPFVVRVRAGLDPASEQFLLDDGFRVAASLPAMVLGDLAAIAADTGGSLEIETADKPAALREHGEVCSQAFGVPAAVVDEVLHRFEARGAAEFYVGRHKGRVVATSMLLPSGHTAGIYNVATLAEARRRGFGEEMTRFALARGAAAGCRHAVLQSSEAGYRIYERLGFAAVGRYLSFGPR